MASKQLTFDIFGRDRTASKAIRGVGNSAARIAKTFAALGGIIAGAFAVRRIVDFARTSVREFATAQDSQTRLADSYARFPKLVDFNIEALRELNAELQNKTKFDDDALASAEASLAQYNLTGKQLAELTPLLADFAAKTGQDLPSAAAALGKALLGNGRGLKAIGVNFKDTGSQAENYAQLVDILTDKVGGFAERQGKDYSGLLAILGNQFGELKEKAGGLFAPALADLATLMGQKVLPKFDEFVTVIGPKVSAFLKGGAADIGKFIDALSGVGKGDFSGVRAFFSEAAKVSPVFAVLNGLATALAPIMPQIGDGLVKIGAALTEEGALEALTTLVTDVLPPLVNLLVAVTPLIPPLAALISGVLVPAIASVAAQFSGYTALLSGNREEMRKWYFNALGMKGPIGDLFRTIAANATNSLNGIIGALNLLAGGLETLVNALSGLTGIRIKLRRIPQVSLAGLLSTGNFTAPTGTTKVAGYGRYAEGGYFTAKPGGYLGVFGEGRHDEVALPLSSDVYDRIGAGIAGARGGTAETHYHLHMGTGTVIANETEFMRWLANAERRVKNLGGTRPKFG